jgi:hypothetical protein
LHVVESWIVEGEQDKSRIYGLDVPVGTWMVSMKVDNDAIWEKYVKEGSVKGFSIEGFFTNKYELAKATVKKDKRYKDGQRELELLSAVEIELGLEYLKNHLTSKD